MKTGTLNVHTENIFPIIKKFLYTDHEIFLRELVSNATDATQKLEMFAKRGDLQEDAGDLKITISLDKEKKTLTISDRGIGMTADEVEKYINQIAFSSAEEFVEKFKDLEDKKQIIGHFGLGFYSSFMVANKVEIFTKSYKKDAEAVHWSCEGNTTFALETTEKEDRGTDVVLHITEENNEFLEEARIKLLLEKYCRFMPFPIEFEGEVVNDPNPIWLKPPTELKDEDYKEFYSKLYPMAAEPLFWIHLNVDYPFNLTGIMYFPQITGAFEVQKNKIHLYQNQVFVTDEVGDIMPEFLTLLHGVVDSPDIPLNVSRSALQADANVKKISSYIVKKVADKLNEIYKNDREGYEKKWKDINVFVKYGMLSDDKFYDKAVDFCLLQNTEGKYFTIETYKEKVKELQKDKSENIVLLYSNDPQKDHSYIEAARKRGYDVLAMEELIDPHFVQQLEQKNEKLTMKRIDAESVDKLIDKGEKKTKLISDKEEEQLKNFFGDLVPKEKFTVEADAMATDDPPVVITENEFMRRMKEMSRLGGGMGQLPENYTVTLNSNHPLAKQILDEKEEARKSEMAQQAFDLARLSRQMLTGSDLSSFIDRTMKMMNKGEASAKPKTAKASTAKPKAAKAEKTAEPEAEK